MWSYYGSKTNLIKYYPKPMYDTIIETFAGAAKYSLRYFDRNIILIDKYPVIVKVWKWLQQCSEKDILNLPKPKRQDSLHNLQFDCEEAKLLMGFVIGCGAEKPRLTPTKRKTIDRPNHVNYHLKNISSQLHKIKHWQIVGGDFTDAPEIGATWFIDPPYQFGGGSYVMSNKKINFLELRQWCESRQGQVIVCENTKADWMSFYPVAEQRGSIKSNTEAIWTNMKTSYTANQTKLF